MYVLLFYGFILNFQSNSSNGVLNGHETDSACEEDIFDDDIKEILGDEPESVIPQQVLDLADHALARLKDISTPDFSTPDLSTPDFSTMNFPTLDFLTPKPKESFQTQVLKP